MLLSRADPLEVGDHSGASVGAQVVLLCGAVPVVFPVGGGLRVVARGCAASICEQRLHVGAVAVQGRAGAVGLQAGVGEARILRGTGEARHRRCDGSESRHGRRVQLVARCARVDDVRRALHQDRLHRHLRLEGDLLTGVGAVDGDRLRGEGRGGVSGGSGGGGGDGGRCGVAVR